MCGYDPFEWYEREIDNQYIAQINGFDCYEDYYNSIQDGKMNADYDRYADDMVEKEK